MSLIFYLIKCDIQILQIVCVFTEEVQSGLIECGPQMEMSELTETVCIGAKCFGGHRVRTIIITMTQMSATGAKVMKHSRWVVGGIGRETFKSGNGGPQLGHVHFEVKSKRKLSQFLHRIDAVAQ